jgi:hypothetical protein
LTTWFLSNGFPTIGAQAAGTDGVDVQVMRVANLLALAQEALVKIRPLTAGS